MIVFFVRLLIAIIKSDLQFQMMEHHILATQGNSTQLFDIKHKDKTTPDISYHGRASRFMAEIREQGLLTQSRQYLHLSSDEYTTI